MDKRALGWAFVVFIIIYSIFTATQYHRLAQSMANMEWYKAVLLSILLNLSYLIIIVGSVYFAHAKGGALFKSFIIAVLFVFCMDIVGFPHCIRADSLEAGCGSSTNVMTVMDSDYHFLKAIVGIGVPYKIAFWIYYVGFPLVLVLIIVQIAGWVELTNRLRRMST